MNRSQWLRVAAEPFRGEHFRPTVILLVSPFLLTTWKYFGAPSFYLDCLAPRLPLGLPPGAAAAAYSFLACFFLLGVVPALIVKLAFRQRLADYGVQLGNPVRTFRTMAIFVPVFLLSGYVASLDPAVLQQYPINRHAGDSAAMFAFHALTYLTFYLGWEFYFRGFMQCGLRGTMGDVNAVLVQVLASCLLHIGRPPAEVYGSILGALLWGFLVLRTRSLLSGLVQHYVLGISLDWLIMRAG
jgi:hypothetical protein